MVSTSSSEMRSGIPLGTTFSLMGENATAWTTTLHLCEAVSLSNELFARATRGSIRFSGRGVPGLGGCELRLRALTDFPSSIAFLILLSTLQTTHWTVILLPIGGAW